ncbi:hypothetical protein KUTeg_011197 [Tegillarca granosa]|uniref:HTH psq-type domain-containing protein n=1 Tax=Tegillarca granosa TaxID=220873 RepID=A0ABQ9F1G2_TEGGR|nr:hypothetical protein KUTeg_011197 [Tegillarca granosa]
MEIRLAKEYRKGKYRSNYNINDMSKAYLLVKDKGVSVESAARKCGVPVTTLKDRVRGRINMRQ